MKRHTPLLVIMLLVFLLSSCFKANLPLFPNQYKDEFPAQTHTGLNTAGFYLNGKQWIAHQEYIWAVDKPFKLIEAKYSNKTLFIKIDKNLANKSSEIFEINIKSPLVSQGSNIFLKRNTLSTASFLEDKCLLFDSGEGNINITFLDSSNHIVSGTFNVTFLMQGCDTMKITDGRFDIKYD
jgi:hypothetical protein